MTQERKRLCLFTAVNFIVGIIVGMILFYGQQKSNAAVFEGGYEYDKAVELIDFFRVSWLNLLWLFAIFIAHNILPLSAMHPIMLVRGCMSAFSLMYILNYVGIKEAFISAVPQCFSVLPLLMFFSVEAVRKRRQMCDEGKEPFSLRRSELAFLFFMAALSGGVEVVLFRFFCICLF